MSDVPRLRTPGEIAAVAPLLVGFAPEESLVALSLRGPRSRVGLVLRVDLTDSPALVEQVVSALVADGARSALLLVHTATPSAGEEHPWAPLVAAVEARLQERRVAVPEALLVRDGRWWSYRCRLACCPPQGLPVEEASGQVGAVAAEQALRGRAPLRSRAELVASVAPALALGAAPAQQRQDRAVAELRRQLREDPEGARRRALARWRTALDRWEQRPVDVDPEDAAALVAALHAVLVRDQVAAWCLDRPEALLGLLLHLCRGAVPPHDAPVCAVLAWVAYAQGQGALALVAVERALRTDPGCSLAALLDEALEQVVPPERVRAALRSASGELGRRGRRSTGRRTVA